jgi:hypothetical protein
MIFADVREAEEKAQRWQKEEGKARERIMKLMKLMVESGRFKLVQEKLLPLGANVFQVLPPAAEELVPGVPE